MIAGGGAAGLVFLGAWLDGPLKRLVVASIAGVLAAGLLMVLFPQCLTGPFGALEAPIIQEWRSSLVAARNAAKVFSDSLSVFLIVYCSTIVGLGAAVYLFLRAPSEQRRNWLLVFLFILAGLLLSAWLVRVASFATAIAVIPAASNYCSGV